VDCMLCVRAVFKLCLGVSQQRGVGVYCFYWTHAGTCHHKTGCDKLSTCHLLDATFSIEFMYKDNVSTIFLCGVASQADVVYSVNLINTPLHHHTSNQ